MAVPLLQLWPPLALLLPKAMGCLLGLQVGVWKKEAPELLQMSHKVTSACVSVAPPGAGRAGEHGHLAEHDFAQSVIGVLLQRRKENGRVWAKHYAIPAVATQTL